MTLDAAGEPVPVESAAFTPKSVELGAAELEAARTAFDALALRYFTAKEHSDDLHAACVGLAALLRRAR